MEHTMRGDSLQREIIEGRMDGKRGKPRQKLMDWMMSEGYSKLKEEAKHREHGTIGGMDLPEGRELNEEVIENSKNNYAATMASAARRQIIGGGAAMNKSRRRRRPQIVGGGGAARPAHGSTVEYMILIRHYCRKQSFVCTV